MTECNCGKYDDLSILHKDYCDCERNMKKYYRGKVVSFATGAVQFVRNNEAKKDFILLTGRQGDIYIPAKVLHKALEDQWDADCMERGDRK